MKNSVFIFIFFPPSSPNFGRTMFVKQGNKKKQPNVKLSLIECSHIITLERQLISQTLVIPLMVFC